jgi:phospholipid/cholesterol/gamma-HCH transport system substrate-binding protein
MRTGSEVRVGAITVLAIILMAAYVFYIRGYRAAVDTYRVCVTFQDARGLQRGDPVRMVGVKIGEVATVEINMRLKADVTLTVDKRYELYEDYRFQIATSGLIQERFVEVIPEPPNPYVEKMKDGSCVEGVLQPSLSDLVAVGAQVLDNLNRTSHSLNVVLTDQEILSGMRDALQSFSAAAKAASRLAATTAALADASQPDVLATLQQLRVASEDLQVVTSEFRTRLAQGTTLDDLEETAHYARETAANAAKVSSALAGVADDPHVQDQLRSTLSAIHDAAQSAKQVGEDLEVFSAELREAAPVVPKIAAEAEESVGAAAAIRDRLKPPDIKAAFDVVYSGKADRWFSTGRLDFQTRPDRFFRIGMDDIGEENDVNVQLGDRQDRYTLRYGLVRSRLGFGVDLSLPRRTTLSLDVFDPNNVRADLLADIPIVPGRDDWSILVGARDLGDGELFVGGVRLKR